MSFKNFTSTDIALTKYHLSLRYEEFIDLKTVPPLPIHPVVWELIKFDLQHLRPATLETSICETLIYPLLREVWRCHPKLHVWSHISIKVDDELTGIPDYLVTKTSEQGLSGIILPLLAVIEAKREDFVTGWGQCLAEMYAAQQLNANSHSTPVIYGIVTTGKTWEFGKLMGSQAIIHPFSFSLAPPETLLGILNYIFSECEAQC